MAERERTLGSENTADTLATPNPPAALPLLLTSRKAFPSAKPREFLPKSSH